MYSPLALIEPAPLAEPVECWLRLQDVAELVVGRGGELLRGRRAKLSPLAGADDDRSSASGSPSR